MTWDHTDRPVEHVTDLQTAGVCMEPHATTWTVEKPHEVVVQLTTIWQPAAPPDGRVDAIIMGLAATRREAAACLLEADGCLTQALVWRDRGEQIRAEATRHWAAAVLARAETMLSEWDVPS